MNEKLCLVEISICYQIEGFQINDSEFSSVQGDHKSCLSPQVWFTETDMKVIDTGKIKIVRKVKSLRIRQ